jgi:hypothetical protein
MSGEAVKLLQQFDQLPLQEQKRAERRDSETHR